MVGGDTLLNRLNNLVTNGPKNKLWFIAYVPALILASVLIIFLLMAVLPELIAWTFGLACIVSAIVWPIAKIIELITGKKML